MYLLFVLFLYNKSQTRHKVSSLICYDGVKGAGDCEIDKGFVDSCCIVGGSNGM